MNLDIHIISHTHWDREWYLTREQYRLRLVGLIDRVLDRLETDARFTHFHLDGQTIVIEDYLEARPDQETRLRRHIASGRLLAGPWYVMPDMHHVSGESLVRNLALGHKIAESFGGVMRAGYMPDPFGHVAQMPQILRGFGLDSAILWRGFGGERAEYIWRAPDGSEVLLLHLPPEGYCNALWLPLRGADHMRAQGLALVEREAARSRSGALLMMVGVDHVEPHSRLRDLPAVLSETTGAQARISTLPAYVAAVRKRIERPGGEGKPTPLECIHGELRAGEEYCNLLPGVLSARTYLKRENVRTQSLLERVAEPLTALAWMLGEEHPSGILNYAWRTLLQNHPHDSICGCSVDEVHDENMTRFARAQQAAEAVTVQALQWLARRADAPPKGSMAALVISAAACGGVVEGQVDVPFEIAESGRRFDRSLFETRIDLFKEPGLVSVREASGSAVPFQILGSEDVLIHAMSRYEPPLALQARRLRVAMFLPQIAALMPTRLELVMGDPPESPPALPSGITPVMAGESWIDNGIIRLEARTDGAFDLVDHRHNRRYAAALAMTDEGDVGDEYNFSPPAAQRVMTNTDALHWRVDTVDPGPLVASMEATFDFPLPPRAHADRRSRGPGEAPLSVRLKVSVTAGSPRVSVRVSLTNRAEDHRLRLVFPTGASRVETTRADAAFAVLERSARRDQPEVTLHELPVNAVPVHSVIDAGDATAGVSVWTEGLNECEVVDTAGGPAIAVTLLRCVGFLSRDDLSTRRGHAGPGLPTPGAQCPGRHEFRLAFEPRSAPPAAESLLATSASFLAPPRFVGSAGPVGVADVSKPGALPNRPFVSLVSEPPDAAVLSALKKCDARESLVVRVFNARPESAALRLSTCRPVREAYRLDLREARKDPLQVKDAVVQLNLREAAIETIELVLA